jgi:hypothetical protein
MEQSISSESAKRARLDHLEAQKDDENDPLLVDWDSFCVTSPVRDLADETTRHTTAPVTVATSGYHHHRNSPVSGVSVTGLESAVMTAQEALQTLDSEETSRLPSQEGVHILQKQVERDSAIQSHKDSAHPSVTSQTYQSAYINWTVEQKSSKPSAHPAAIVEDLSPTASIKPTPSPSTSQNDGASGHCVSSVDSLPVAKKNAVNSPLDSVDSSEHNFSSTESKELELNRRNSSSVSRVMNPPPENAPKKSQLEKTYSVSTQVSAQVPQIPSTSYNSPYIHGVRFLSSNIKTTRTSDWKLLQGGNSLKPTGTSESTNSVDGTANDFPGTGCFSFSSQDAETDQVRVEQHREQTKNSKGTIWGSTPHDIGNQGEGTDATKFGPPAPPSITTQLEDQRQASIAPSSLAPPQNKRSPPLPSRSNSSNQSSPPPPPSLSASTENQVLAPHSPESKSPHDETSASLPPPILPTAVNQTSSHPMPPSHPSFNSIQTQIPTPPSSSSLFNERSSIPPPSSLPRSSSSQNQRPSPSPHVSLPSLYHSHGILHPAIRPAPHNQFSASPQPPPPHSPICIIPNASHPALPPPARPSTSHNGMSTAPSSVSTAASYQNHGPPPPPPPPVSTQNQNYSNGQSSLRNDNLPLPHPPTPSSYMDPDYGWPAILPPSLPPPPPPPPSMNLQNPRGIQSLLSPALRPTSQGSPDHVQKPPNINRNQELVALLLARDIASSSFQAKLAQQQAPPISLSIKSGPSKPSVSRVRADSSRRRQHFLESDATIQKQFNETVIIHLLIQAHTDPKQTHSRQAMALTSVFPAFDVLKQTVEELFLWVSSNLKTAPPERLDFAFTNFDTVEMRLDVYQGGTKAFETLKSLAWERFKRLASPSPEHKIRILITPYFSSPSEAPKIPDLPPLTSKMLFHTFSLTTPNQHESNTASDSTRRISSSQPGISLPISPRSQSQSNMSISSASHTSNSYRSPTTPTLSSESIIIEDDTPERKLPEGKDITALTSSTNFPEPKCHTEKPSSQIPSSNNVLPTLSQEPLRQSDGTSVHNPEYQTERPTPQNQPLDNATPTASGVRLTKTQGTNPPSPQNQESKPALQDVLPSPTPPTPKIVIRIQVSASGQLSNAYPHTVLSARTKCSKFFSWFEQETNRQCSGKLKFDFKDALPAKSSVVERSNEDHFELMVGDIKRKFARAVKLAPDLKEFCIVVTDPEWEEEREDADEDD